MINDPRHHQIRFEFDHPEHGAVEGVATIPKHVSEPKHSDVTLHGMGLKGDVQVSPEDLTDSDRALGVKHALKTHLSPKDVKKSESMQKSEKNSGGIGWSEALKAAGGKNEGHAYIIHGFHRNLSEGMHPHLAFSEAADNENYHGDRPDVVKERNEVASKIKAHSGHDVKYLSSGEERKSLKKSETMEKKAPEGVDPDKHEKCVKEVKKDIAEGKTEPRKGDTDVATAHKICTASMKKGEKGKKDLTEEGKKKLHPEMREHAEHMDIHGKPLKKFDDGMYLNEMVKSEDVKHIVGGIDPEQAEFTPREVAQLVLAKAYRMYKTTHSEMKDIHSKSRDPEKGKKIGNNTSVHRRGKDYAVKLHQTDVVTTHPEGHYTLSSGGWKTPTTQKRINDHLPEGVKVAQHKGEWHVHDRHGNKHPFEDNMRIDEHGAPVSGAKMKKAEEPCDDESYEPIGSGKYGKGMYTKEGQKKMKEYGFPGESGKDVSRFGSESRVATSKEEREKRKLPKSEGAKSRLDRIASLKKAKVDEGKEPGTKAMNRRERNYRRDKDGGPERITGVPQERTVGEPKQKESGIQIATTKRDKGVSDVGAMVRNPGRRQYGEGKVNAAKDIIRRETEESKKRDPSRLPKSELVNAKNRLHKFNGMPKVQPTPKQPSLAEQINFGGQHSGKQSQSQMATRPQVSAPKPSVKPVTSWTKKEN